MKLTLPSLKFVRVVLCVCVRAGGGGVILMFELYDNYMNFPSF